MSVSSPTAAVRMLGTLPVVATPLALPCAPDDAWISVDVALHGAGPLWLVMVHEPVPDRPQWLYSSTVVTWAIDEIAFVP